MSSDPNQENWEKLDSWLLADMRGKPGSILRKAFDLKLDLESLGETKYDARYSPHQRKALRRNYGLALIRILKAFDENDAEFFSMVANGLAQLQKKEETAVDTVLHCLAWTYASTTSRTTEMPIPTKAEIIEMTKRQWAIRLLTCLPLPASLTYDPGFEAEIAQKIRGLHRQNWTRHFKTLGLKLPDAKRGPKQA